MELTKQFVYLSKCFKELPLAVQNKIKVNNLDRSFKELLLQQGYQNIEELFAKDFTFRQHNSSTYDDIYFIAQRYWQIRDSVNAEVDYKDGLNFDFLDKPNQDYLRVLTKLMLTTNHKYGVILDIRGYKLSTLTRYDVLQMSKGLRGEIDAYFSTESSVL